MLVCWFVTKLLGCLLCLLSAVRFERPSLFLPLVWITFLGIWRGLVVWRLLLTLRVVLFRLVLSLHKDFVWFSYRRGSTLEGIESPKRKFLEPSLISANFENCGGRYGLIMFLLNWFSSWFALPARERASLNFVRGGIMSIFHPEIFWWHYKTLKLLWWYLLRELGGTTDQISTSVLLGCDLKEFYPFPFYIQNCYLIGIFPEIFLLRRLLVMILHSQKIDWFINIVIGGVLPVSLLWL